MSSMWKNVWKKRLAVLLALVLVWNVLADHFVSVRASQGLDVREAQIYGEAVVLAEGDVQGEQQGFVVHSFEINLVEGDTEIPITDESEVHAGQEVEVTFEWTLDDSVRLEDGATWVNQIFTIDTNSANFNYSGLNIPGMEAGTETEPLPLYATGQAKVVGSYYMKDGIIYITITDEQFFQHEDNRYGGVSFKGTIADSGDKTEDGKPKEIGFGTDSAMPTYYVTDTESSAAVNKATSGSITPVDGKYYQTFTVTIKAQNGTITNLDLVDSSSPEGMLTNASNVQVTASDVDGVSVGSYASLDEALAAIKAATIYMDQTITLQYTMEVDASIYDQNTYGCTNIISGTYVSNRSEEPKNVSASTWVSGQRPSISKTAADYQVRDGRGYISWTITVNLGDYYTGDSNKLEDYIKNITDIPVENMEDMSNLDLDPALFEQDKNNPAVFTYTVEMEVDRDKVNLIADVIVKNKVSMTTNDDNTYDSHEASYTIPGAGPYIKKTIKDMVRDEEGLHVTWNIRVYGIPVGIKQLTVHEDARHWNNTPGNQTLLYEIYVDNVLVADENGILDTDKIADVSGFGFDSYGNIVFTDTYANEVAAADGEINIQVKTLITENTIGKEYGNGAKVSYTADGASGTTTMPESRATFQDTTNILFKNSTIVQGKDAIDYEIKVILPALNIQSAGQKFVIEDILPVGMQLGDDGAAVILTDQWNNKFADLTYELTKSSVEAEDGSGTTTKLSFEVTATEDWLTKVQDYPGSAQRGYYLVVKYRGEMIDRTQFLADGKAKIFTNSASGTYAGESIGSDSTTNELTPTKIVNKTAEYSQSSAPYIKYTIDVNTEALTLLDGTAKLQAVDTVGSALKFVDADYFTDELSKNKYYVQVLDGTTGQALTADTDYTYTISANRRTINFTLPDSRFIKLVYWAYAIPGTQLTQANSTNSFKLSGFSSDALSSEYSFDMTAYTPSGWAGSEVGSIEIFKFWTDDGQQVALEGSVFRLIKVKYDEATNSLVPDDTDGSEILVDEIKITDENRVGAGTLIIEGLPVNQIMALYEIDADEGFALNKEPYYFILEGSTAVSFPEGLGIKKYSSGGTIDYENKQAGNLILEKTVEGDVAQSDIEGVITFTVKDAGGTLIGTYKPGDTGFTYAGGKWTLKIEDLAPGTYTVEETVYDTTGAVATRVVYSINSGAWSSEAENAKDTSATAAVEAGKDTTVTFKNVYPAAVQTGAIKVAKEFTETTNTLKWDDIKDKISFEIYDASGAQVNGSPIEGRTLTPNGNLYESLPLSLPVGTYTVKEINTAITDYEVTTTYSVTVDNATSATGDTVETEEIVLEDGNVVVVAYANTYSYTGTYPVPISKIELTGGKELAGAVLTITGTKADGSAIAAITWTSGSDGTANGELNPHVVNLYPGTYTLTEITAPMGYVKAAPIDFTVEADGTIKVDGAAADEVVMEDAEIVFEINKLEATGTEEVAGAVLEVYKASDVENGQPKAGAVAVDSWTSAKGAIRDFGDKLTPGESYVLIETYAPAGYTYMAPVEFAVGVDGTITINGTLEQDAYGTYLLRDGVISVKLSKVDATDNDTELAGAVISLYNADDIDADGTVRDGATALDTWTSVVGTPHDFGSKLEVGKRYVFVELRAPNGYAVTTNIEFEVNEDGTITITSSDVTTDANGVILMEDLPLAGDFGMIHLTKSVSGDLDAKDLEGKLQFKVESVDLTPAYSEIFTLGEDGFAYNTTSGKYELTITNLVIGTYKVTEILNNSTPDNMTHTVSYNVNTTPAGSGDTVETGEIAVGKDDEITVAYTNEYAYKMGKIKVAKKFAESTNILTWDEIKDSISFEIYDAAGAQVTGSPIEGKDLTLNGDVYESVELELPVGTYTVKEINTAITGYTVSTVYTVTIDGTAGAAGDTTTTGELSVEEGKTTVVTYENTYAAKVPDPGKLVLTKKVNGVLNASALEGKLQFKVENADSSTPVFNKTYTLGQDGFVWDETQGKYVLTISDLPVGTYKVTEVLGDTTPDNMSCTVTYTVDTVPAVNGSGTECSGVVVGENDTVTVAYTNDYQYRTGSLKVTKTFVEAGNKLAWTDIAPNLSFNIYDSTGVAIAESPIKGVDLALNGAVYESAELVLPIGTYKVEEIHTTIAGYEVTTSYNITVGNTAGAKGDATATGDITLGEGDVITVAYTNTYTYTGSFPVPVSKVSLTGGKEIAGATLTITGTKAMGGDIAPISWETGTDKAVDGALTPHVVNLYPGTYTLTETIVPAGYVKAAPIDFTVKDDGTVVVSGTTVTEVVMKDAEISVKLNKVQLGDHAVEVEGAVIAVFNAGDVNADGTPKTGAVPLDSWTSKAGEIHDFGKVLQTGKSYVFVETVVPGNYEVAANIAFTVNEDGSITITSPTDLAKNGDVILMEDKLKEGEFGELIITKTVKGGVSRELAEKAITFKVTNNATKESTTYKLSDFTYDAVAGVYSLKLVYAAGGYTVEETVSTIEGYKLTKTTYTVDGTTQKGKKVEITVPKDGTETVAFENTYKKKTTKSGGGDDDDDDDDETPSINPPEEKTNSLTRTGDDAPLGLWMALFACGLAGLATGCAALLRRRRRQ